MFVLPFYMLLQVNRHINNKLEWYELALLKKNEEERMVGLARSAGKAASFVVHMDQDLSVWFTESI